MIFAESDILTILYARGLFGIIEVSANVPLCLFYVCLLLPIQI